MTISLRAAPCSGTYARVLSACARLPQLLLPAGLDERLASRDRVRQWALTALRERAAAERFSGGAVLIEIALAEGDQAAAWAAADEFGPGHEWEQLAKATSATQPGKCAALYRAKVEKDLQHPNSSAYAGVAATLVTIRALGGPAGDADLGAALDTRQLVLIDLWAPWCGPCRMVAPVLEKLAERHAGKLKVIKVNVDEAPVAAAQFEAQSIPTLVLMRDGQVVERVVGAQPEPVLDRIVTTALAGPEEGVAGARRWSPASSSASSMTDPTHRDSRSPPQPHRCTTT